LAALRNVIGEMFESVVLIRHPGFGSSATVGRGVAPDVPGPDPQVSDRDANYWLLPRLGLSAVDAATFNPTGQLTPVPPRPQ
jgi:hypothetical protein